MPLTASKSSSVELEKEEEEENEEDVLFGGMFDKTGTGGGSLLSFLVRRGLLSIFFLLGLEHFAQ